MLIKIILVSFLVFIFVIFIGWKNIIPRSEIKLEKGTHRCKVFSFDSDFRYFNVLDSLMADEINEIFTCPYIEWDNHCYSSHISFFDGVECKYYKKIIDKVIEPNTFIYFPDNNVKWNDKNFLYDKKNNLYYFPEKNSVLYTSEKLEWNLQNNNFFIVLGKVK